MRKKASFDVWRRLHVVWKITRRR